MVMDVGSAVCPKGTPHHHWIIHRQMGRKVRESVKIVEKRGNSKIMLTEKMVGETDPRMMNKGATINNRAPIVFGEHYELHLVQTGASGETLRRSKLIGFWHFSQIPYVLFSMFCNAASMLLS